MLTCLCLPTLEDAALIATTHVTLKPLNCDLHITLVVTLAAVHALNVATIRKRLHDSERTTNPILIWVVLPTILNGNPHWRGLLFEVSDELIAKIARLLNT